MSSRSGTSTEHFMGTSTQKIIVRMCDSNTREGYIKLLLAMNLTLPMAQLKTSMKVPKQNGVRLIKGKITMYIIFVIANSE